jgi:hypothetical protein
MLLPLVQKHMSSDAQRRQGRATATLGATQEIDSDKTARYIVRVSIFIAKVRK